mmetsp:Transcript_33973/g.61582  ORF Transcript_33973/g.61582 Transcript_33973/m.61582 type:complete len:126 (+) Transcript_33973:40-417(+)|eukprot:CAMPEP_0197706026 /NCGR_PEP_ID=MMETSP1338-20131121/126737_1 /TAXON_ID=43686 ORGANISM="Pelagodinium beii, Strain RCC1491" /NCGR_SAMPLE_ID=MMETSP1338 /ASSEMBLY_ACC=CAM_ASM_000754 /LENGTH=125 /DNA_ID=CAMNT_0043289935 /DNA_START=40 /DNA_END=417 /DNA_ORIENTATION=-
MASRRTKASKGKGSKKRLKFTIDCSVLVDDDLLETGSFEKFMQDKIKVNGKAGNLGDAVEVTCDKTKVYVSAEAPFSKRYLKYLTKKYLKKFQLRDYLHVIASDRDRQAYELKYFKIGDDAADDN